MILDAQYKRIETVVASSDRASSNSTLHLRSIRRWLDAKKKVLCWCLSDRNVRAVILWRRPLPLGSKSISATAILIIAWPEPAGSIMSRQWVSFNYGSARPCARALRKSEMLPIPNNPKQDAMKLWLSIAVNRKLSKPSMDTFACYTSVNVRLLILVLRVLN